MILKRAFLILAATLSLSLAKAQNISQRVNNIRYKKARKQWQIKEHNPTECWTQQYLNTMNHAIGNGLNRKLCREIMIEE
mgnify:CR=1 FL=1|jgi:hypothetical protein